MKHIKSLFLLLLAVCFSVGAYAQTNRIYIPDVKMSRGSEAILSVYMDNTEEITAVEFTLEVPSGFTINPVSAELAERSKNHQITARKLKNGKYRFVVMSESNVAIDGMGGILFTMQLNAAESLTDETGYPFTMSDAVMSLKSGENILQESTGGTVTIKSLPNLHVVSVDCSDPVAGSEMTVKWKVRNDGRGSTGDDQWKDYIWLVPNIEGGTSMRDSKLLKTVDNVTALQPGESYENTVSILLDERIYGNYDIVVIADKYGVNSVNFGNTGGNAPRPYNPEVDGYLSGYPVQNGNVLEEGETYRKTDNFFYQQIDIVVPPLADLQVPTIIASVIPTRDLLPMVAGARKKVNVVVVEPEEPTEDELLMPWYEAYIPNALSYANLRHSNAFYSGKKVKVKVIVANKGAVDSKKSFKTTLYMSSSSDINTATLYPIDTQTCSENIAAGGETELTFAFYLPYEWYGDTYFHAYADINDEVYELANTANNWGISSNYNVLLCPGADFVPGKLVAPSMVSSSSFTVSYKVDNLGAGIPYRNTWKDKIYLSTKADGLDDSAIELGSFEQTGSFYSDAPMVLASGGSASGGGIGYVSGGDTSGSNSDNTAGYSIYTEPEKLKYKGDSYTATRTVQIPNPSIGTYYIYVKVDADDEIFEFDGENNNILCSGPVQVSVPDLAVEIISISEETLITENKVAVAWKIKNVGSADVQNVTITDGFYASSNANGTNAVALGEATNQVSLVAGGEKVFRTNITIPRDSRLNGSRHFFVKTNIKNTLQESTTENNISAAIVKQFEYVEDPAVVKVNGTNITVTGLQVASTTTTGEDLAVSYTIKNTGTLAIDTDVSQEVFISERSSFDSSAKALLVKGTLPSVAGLQAGQSVTTNISVNIPSDMKGGQKYLFVYTNRNKTLREKKSDDNSVKSPVYINGNLPDYAMSDLVVPATIKTSEKTEITWTLSNAGNWEAPVAVCGVYLSADATLDRNDKELARVQTNKLAPNVKQRMDATITIDDNITGNYYIIVKANVNNSSEELSAENNMAQAAVAVQQSPLPDLALSDITVDGTLRPGTKVTVKAKVQNVGDDVTHKDKWTDAFYLSTDFTLDTKKATNVGGKTHVGNVQKDGSYEVATTINIPANVHGYCFLYAKTDATDAHVEKDKDNNVTRIRVYVENDSDTPADLTVKKIAAPSSITAGAPVTLSYTLVNNGQFAANGNLREVIYLSKDEQWDENDQMVGVVNSTIDLAAGNEEVRQITGRITNVVEGKYYLIIRTNATHAIAETDYDNNMATTASTSSIDFANLSLGSTTTVNTSGYYKLAVNNGWTGKTIGLNMTHDADAPAGLYVAFDRVPSTARYDRSSNVIQTTEQELLIPNVQEGNYYILAQDNSATGLNSNEFVLNGSGSISGSSMNLSAQEVQFGATSLSIREGGTDGWLTTEIHGALLDSIMDFRLARDGRSIPAEAVTFHDQTYSHVTFNLKDAKTGSYDVVSELPDGSLANLSDGFKVIPGQSVNLGVKMDLPAGARSSFYAPFSIAFANGGNTDIAIRELLVVTDNGIIATSIEGLKERKRELHIVPDFGQDKRGFVTIPPGAHEVINCFIEVSSTSNVTVYIVK